MADLRKDLPMAMMIAAFTGVSWYIGIEINTSLFLLFKRRRGLYFWSCALASWGVILQPVFIILADFGVWQDAVPSIAMIYLTWLIMVVPQSWVLYSRLHLLMREAKIQRAIKYVLIFNSVVFSVPTIIIGTLAQSTNVNPSLSSFNLIWDRVQLVVFFTQETALSILYIFQTRKYLLGRSALSDRSWSTPSAAGGIERAQSNERKSVLWQLIYANLLIIALDITLLGIQCADLFYLQGALKPCVYGIKLKVEFVILNRLISLVQKPSTAVYQSGPDSGVATVGSDQRTRNNDRWHKHSRTDPMEDDNGMQLVESNASKASRSHSTESQLPIYHAA